MSVSNTEVTDALKIALKSRGITYGNLAQKLNVSEKTIKRLFKDRDCSLSRLSKICEAINLSLHDLFDFAKQYSEPLINLSETQQAFLRDHRHHFHFLFFLTIGHSIEQIQGKYHLNDFSLFRYLRDLDRQGFILLREENRFQLLVNGKLLLPLHGPLHDIIRSSNRLFLEYVIDRSKQPGVCFSGFYRYMTPETLGELQNDLVEIANKYKRLANRDEAVLPREKLTPVKCISLAAPFDVLGKWDIGQLER